MGQAGVVSASGIDPKDHLEGQVMKLRSLIASGAIALLSTTSLASALDVAEVDVTAELTALQNPQAAAFWADLETDLEAAILSQLVDQITDDGARLVVNIEGFGIGDEADLPFTVEDAALSGRIHVIDLTNNANFQTFELNVSIQGMSVTDTEGEPVMVAQMPPEWTYETLITAFAEGVVERLD